MTILLMISIALLSLCAILLVRNQQVYKFRIKVVNEVYKDADYQEKQIEYQSISYGEMLLKFWKPLKSFYKTLGK